MALHIFGFKLTHEGEYYYLTKHHCPKKQNSLFKKHSIKGEEPENLTYQFSWIQSKPWHVYSKDLHGNLVKVGVLFDQNSGSKPQGKFNLNCISRCS